MTSRISSTKEHKRGDKKALQAVKKHDWHAISIEEVFERLAGSEAGLGKDEVVSRQEKFGDNAFSETPERGVVYRLYQQLKSPLTLVLVIAFFITFVLREYVDAVVIAFALSIAVIVGLLQEGKASRAFKKLSESQVLTATVLRGGKLHDIPSKELVVGDVVEVRAGTQVPADIRLFSTKALQSNEAMLTGEWLAVSKHTEPVAIGLTPSDQKNMLFMGALITRGHGRGVVVATGDDTVVGRLAQDVQSVVDEKTPLQIEMGRISRIMLYVVMLLVALIFTIGILRDIPLSEMLFTSIAIAVASIPEGLPAAVTIILAVGMEALLKRGGLVKNLLAAETLGSTTYILTDKTGTLTKAQMSVASVLVRDREYDTAYDEMWATDPLARDIFDVALCATEAFVDEQEDGSLLISGEPMERSILHAADEIGLDARSGSLRARRLDHLAFTSENRFAVGLAQSGAQRRLCINGAPELIIEQCTKVADGDGVRNMTDADRKHFIALVSTQTKKGLRLIAVAHKYVETDDVPDDAGTELILGATFMGLLVFKDPIREGVAGAIRDVKEAGLKIMLVTGDNPETALSIAQEVGIAKKDDTPITGSEIEELDDDALLRALRTTTVFARVLPHQKMRLATILQKHGEIVAMTGDGVNDASALQKANIGIAVGSGAEVAKEAADLVLVNDSFETIKAAIEEGRRIVNNLRKIVGYLISTSFSEMLLIATALIAGFPVPITAAQILWANIIEEGLMSVAFAFEPGEKNAMKQKPRDVHEEGVLSKTILSFMALVIAILSALLLALYFYLIQRGSDIEEIRSVMFIAIAMDSLFIAFSFRSLSTPLWQIDLRSNLFFIGSFLISFVLLFIVLSVPFFQYLLSYQPISMQDLILVVFGFGLGSLITIEIGKWVFFERQK